MNTDEQLHQLYRDLAEAQRGLGQGAKAADSFALALYYARRVGDVEQVRECRQKISDCNPGHIVCRESTAPLFFAQLLMRNPPDEAEQALRALQAGRGPARSSVAAVSTLEIDPFAYARVDPMDGVTEIPFDFPADSSPQPAEPKLDWQSEARQPPTTTTGTEGLDNHHLFSFTKVEKPTPREPAPLEDLFGLKSVVVPQATPSAVKDYLFEEPAGATSPGDAAREETWSGAASVIHAASILTLILGAACVSFFGYELYPTVKKLDVPRLVARFEQAVLKSKSEPASMNEGEREGTQLQPSSGARVDFDLPAPAPLSRSTVRARDDRGEGRTTR